MVAIIGKIIKTTTTYSNYNDFDGWLVLIILLSITPNDGFVSIIILTNNQIRVCHIHSL